MFLLVLSWYSLFQLLNPGLKNVEKQLWSGRTQRQSNRSYSRRFRFRTAGTVWQCPQTWCSAASAAPIQTAEPPRFVFQTTLNWIKITFSGLQFSQPREQHWLRSLCTQRHPACIHHPPFESAQLPSFPAADICGWPAESATPTFKAAVLRPDSGTLPAPWGLGASQNSARTSLLFEVMILYFLSTIQLFIFLNLRDWATAQMFTMVIPIVIVEVWRIPLLGFKCKWWWIHFSEKSRR